MGAMGAHLVPHRKKCSGSRTGWCARFPTGLLLLFALSAGETAGIEREPAHEGRSSDEPVTEAGLEEEFRRTREALRASPQHRSGVAESHFRLGETLAHRGDLTGAVEEYQAAIRLRPGYAEAYRGLGVVMLDRHDWAGAVEALQATIRLRNNDGEASYWLGRGLMGQGDWTGAAAALRRATQLKPEDADALADLGLVRMVQGDLMGADTALRHAVRLKPDHAEVHHLLETLHSFQHDPERVKLAARRILDTLFHRE